MNDRIAATIAAAVLTCSLPALAQERAAPTEQGAKGEAQQGGATAPQQSTQTQTPAPAQQGPAKPGADTEAEKKKLEEEIRRELGGAGAAQPQPHLHPAQPPAGSSPETPSAPQGSTGGNPMARLLLLPDISAIGSAGFAYDSYDVGALSPRTQPFSPRAKPEFYFQELELGLQAVVDPYVRADVFISFAQEGVSVEEAYVTTLSLPGALQIKAGQFFSPFGRQNQQHPHVWEFVDEPLPRTRLVAQEVLSGPGVDVAWLAPLPWFAELHLAGQTTVPYPNDVAQLTGIARVIQYFQLGEPATLGLGFSAARRQEPGGGAFRDLGVIDAYLRFRPLTTRAYLALQSELYARRFENVPDVPQVTQTGGYVQAFWRQDAYLGYGVRYDWAPSGGNAAPGAERRLGAVATWFASEFMRLRAQPSWDRLPGGRDGFELLLALEFAIGAHGAHPF
jgi:hypothetical protein